MNPRANLPPDHVALDAEHFTSEDLLLDIGETLGAGGTTANESLVSQVDDGQRPVQSDGVEFDAVKENVLAGSLAGVVSRGSGTDSIKTGSLYESDASDGAGISGPLRSGPAVETIETPGLGTPTSFLGATEVDLSLTPTAAASEILLNGTPDLSVADTSIEEGSDTQNPGSTMNDAVIASDIQPSDPDEPVNEIEDMAHARTENEPTHVQDDTSSPSDGDAVYDPEQVSTDSSDDTEATLPASPDDGGQDDPTDHGLVDADGGTPTTPPVNGNDEIDQPGGGNTSEGSDAGDPADTDLAVDAGGIGGEVTLDPVEDIVGDIDVDLGIDPGALQGGTATPQEDPEDTDLTLDVGGIGGEVTLDPVEDIVGDIDVDLGIDLGALPGGTATPEEDPEDTDLTLDVGGIGGEVTLDPVEDVVGDIDVDLGIDLGALPGGTAAPEEDPEDTDLTLDVGGIGGEVTLDPVEDIVGDIDVDLGIDLGALPDGTATPEEDPADTDLTLDAGGIGGEGTLDPLEAILGDIDLDLRSETEPPADAPSDTDLEVSAGDLDVDVTLNPVETLVGDIDIGIDLDAPVLTSSEADGGTEPVLSLGEASVDIDADALDDLTGEIDLLLSTDDTVDLIGFDPLAVSEGDGTLSLLGDTETIIGDSGAVSLGEPVGDLASGLGAIGDESLGLLGGGGLGSISKGGWF
ncbi:hypothetical protein [Palleronia sp. LCG004]|uniref:hypothetical protein n=1 Tax=Palleronia sp. LCG004 TaxID=3079304 RepID=UPI002942D979|nr:hypothetical protein [Palleronia sp. LCG004]WOI56222.1 hypothetical protein RVY76_00050 [Palleronia sp. LCG004]